MTVLVTGATGTTGRRLVARLAASDHRVKAASRSAASMPGAESVLFDWYRPATFAAALDGVDRVYLLPPVGELDPAAAMAPFLEQARAAGVRRAVLLSSSAVPKGGPAVGRVHALLPDLFDAWAVLRPSWFMQNFTGDHPQARSIRDHGVIMSATGTGRVGFVDADDIAAVAARALTGPPVDDELILTGPQALSYDEVASIITGVTGRSVAHQHLGHEDLRGLLAESTPADFASMLADLDVAIAGGAEDRTTDTVERITGRPPTDFRTALEREHRARPDRD